jgi:hypothetical protein
MYRSSRSYLHLEQLEAREVLDASAFPNTANGIFIFSDQLNQGLSDKMVQFIASHYVGSQKLVPTENARYVADNPDWVLLNYRLATASGPVKYIHDGTWSSDWSEVDPHEDWFMHNADGKRLHSAPWDWYLHDINNSDFRQYWLNSVIKDLRTNGAQGVFADSFDAGISDGWFDVYDVRFAGAGAGDPSVWPGGVTWLDQLHDLITYMENGLAATNEQFVYIPNLDGLNTSWDTLDTSGLDGAFLEGFGNSGPAYLHGGTSDWILSMNRALAMSSAGKILIMQPYLVAQADSTTGLLQRGFDLGTYLLLKGDYTYLNIGAPGGSPTGAYYYPEYNIDLGNPTAPVASAVSQYAWKGIYRRDFENGIVLVNPTNSTVTIDLGQAYQQVVFSGGGALKEASLDADGNFIGGSLTQTSVQMVTLKPASAAILLNSAPQPPAPPSPPGGPTPSGTPVAGAILDTLRHNLAGIPERATSVEPQSNGAVANPIGKRFITPLLSPAVQPSAAFTDAGRLEIAILDGLTHKKARTTDLLEGNEE